MSRPPLLHDLADRRERPPMARRLLGAAPSVIGHLAILLVILAARSDPRIAPIEDAPVMASLVQGEKPSPEPKPAPVAPKAPAKSAPKSATHAARASAKPLPPAHALTRRVAAQAPADAAAAGKDPRPMAPRELTEAELAGAASADGGAPGATCDLAGRVQGALRKDPLVQAAVASSPGKAIRVWNGDWVKNRGEDGKGLAAVREAIMWEIAFAPEACRSKPVHGMVLLSMTAAPGAVRLAVGSGDWRWSDLLRPTASP